MKTYEHGTDFDGKANVIRLKHGITGTFLQDNTEIYEAYVMLQIIRWSCLRHTYKF